MKIKISFLGLVLVILVLLGPIFDLLTGYTLHVTNTATTGNIEAITPGVFYRGLFLVPVFIILAHLLKSHARLLVYYLGIVFVIGILVRGFGREGFEVARDGQRFLKLALPIIGFTGMLFVGNYFTRNKPVELYWKTAVLYGGLAAFGLLTTDRIGLVLNVYRGTTAASAGLIDSQNAAGLILIISLPLALFYTYKYRNNSIVWVFLIEALWLTAAFRLNTRAALVGVPSVIILHHMILFVKGYYTRSTFKTISWIVLVILTAVFAFFIIQDWVGRDVQYILDRFQLLAEGQFRNRVSYGVVRIQDFSASEHLFGLGDKYFPTVENDFVDIYGKFGLTTLIPIFLFFGYFYSRLLVIFIRHKQHSTFALLLSMTLYMGHAVTGGHALLSSPVNNLFFLVYFLGYLEIKQFEPQKVPKVVPDKPPLRPVAAGAVPATGKPPLAYDG